VVQPVAPCFKFDRNFTGFIPREAFANAGSTSFVLFFVKLVTAPRFTPTLTPNVGRPAPVAVLPPIHRAQALVVTPGCGRLLRWVKKGTVRDIKWLSFRSVPPFLTLPVPGSVDHPPALAPRGGSPRHLRRAPWPRNHCGSRRQRPPPRPWPRHCTGCTRARTSPDPSPGPAFLMVLIPVGGLTPGMDAPHSGWTHTRHCHSVPTFQNAMMCRKTTTRIRTPPFPFHHQGRRGPALVSSWGLLTRTPPQSSSPFPVGPDRWSSLRATTPRGYSSINRSPSPSIMLPLGQELETRFGFWQASCFTAVQIRTARPKSHVPSSQVPVRSCVPPLGWPLPPVFLLRGGDPAAHRQLLTALQEAALAAAEPAAVAGVASGSPSPRAFTHHHPTAGGCDTRWFLRMRFGSVTICPKPMTHPPMCARGGGAPSGSFRVAARPQPQSVPLRRIPHSHHDQRHRHHAAGALCLGAVIRRRPVGGPPGPPPGSVTPHFRERFKCATASFFFPCVYSLPCEKMAVK